MFKGSAGGLRIEDFNQALLSKLAKHNRGQGLSRRIRRFLVLQAPPSIDAGEITDKGYVNQRIALERRSDDVRRVQADPPQADVVLVD